MSGSGRSLGGSWSLVTGASSGIGQEIARELGRRGSHLVLVARDQARLSAVAGEIARAHGVETQTLVADLAQPQAPAAIAAELSARGRTIDILINNAGVGLWGDFADTKLEDERRLIELNVHTCMALLKALLPGMRSRRQGRVLNVASTAGFFPGPHMAAYYASKAFMVSFSQAVANELSGSGVTVTCLCPGPTRTRFAEGENVRLFRSPFVMDAATVARTGVHGMLAGRRIVIPGLASRLIVEAGRITPRRLTEAIVGYLNK